MNASTLTQAHSELTEMMSSLFGREMTPEERTESFSRDKARYLKDMPGMLESGLLSNPEYIHYAVVGFLGEFYFPKSLPQSLKAALATSILTADGFMHVRKLDIIKLLPEAADAVRPAWKLLSERDPVIALAVLILYSRLIKNPEIRSFLEGDESDDTTSNEDEESAESDVLFGIAAAAVTSAGFGAIGDESFFNSDSDPDEGSDPDEDTPDDTDDE